MVKRKKCISSIALHAHAVVVVSNYAISYYLLPIISISCCKVVTKIALFVKNMLFTAVCYYLLLLLTTYYVQIILH